jgi:hypothetical protein
MFVADYLEALDLLSVLLEVDVLDEEEAALHPLESDPSLCASGHFPRTDQPAQVSEVGIRPGWLLVSL